MSSALSDHLKESRAFAVWFRDLRVWSVAGFRSIHWQWPEEYVRPLVSALIRRKDEVDRRERTLEDLQLITIHFDGTLEARSQKVSKGFKGRLFFAEPGDVVYSKIDVRNGAIAVVPQHMSNAVVSSEFPVYCVRQDLAEPAYIKLLFKTSYFRHAINGMISGASGRKRVQPDQLEDLLVPLPPLDNQRAIVRRWRLMQETVKGRKQEAADQLAGLNVRFLDALGLRVWDAPEGRRSLIVPWSKFRRWSVSYNEAATIVPALSLGKYPVAELGSVLEFVQYGSSQRANTSNDGTPILRMNNIIDGHLDLTHLKYITLSDRERLKLLLRDGDILFNRTNSKELVGKCAVFHASGDYVFASYLIRLRVNAEQALPDFIAYAINSTIGRAQIDALSRQIIGQANVNTDELRSLRIPLPPLATQTEIMGEILKGIKEVGEEIESIMHFQQYVHKEVEERILGSRPVKDVHQYLQESVA
jgi:type I restriction enzyme, S subunit